ncbi:MAG: preprotein translocase subunit SecA [Desulforegulaceae bacterium]|nr:preprotein translocase subunit SecA [Desulforegulaceae bacterium]
MIINLLKALFGTRNERQLKRISKIVEDVNNFESSVSELSDEELKEKTSEFKKRYSEGESLESILPEAFAVVRETSVRILEMRHFDCQIVGGVVLHEGNIAEMKTGEGKTLVATLPAYLNAITGKGVHIITVNDYLAKRDSEWMGKLFIFLGLSVGVITHGLNDRERQDAYNCDIVYGTNNEFGFDYLRDNMKFRKEDLVQRELNFAIVDEVDSILIDEARTPLIISGPAEKSTELYNMADLVVRKLDNEIHYTVDEKDKNSLLTDEGILKIQKELDIKNIYDPSHIETLHHVNQSLKAHTIFKRDVDYIVNEGQVVIVDEFTGRLMPGRRFSEGLHQALEAKENVKIENENQTLASITFQNYFRMYNVLSGMTGTAETEAKEFAEIYGLEVVVVPTNKPLVRKDFPDVIFKTKQEKYEAAIKEISDCYKKGQPVLVGTVSIDVSEYFSKMLKKRGVPHEVLNAKHHEKEAEIVALAGQKKSVTISTNMAGRGTDIVLGEGVVELGGLHIIGTGRHESRRIDNQLRGRSGRQGDPGSSRFYLSLEDELLRIFGGEKITRVMDRLGMKEGETIEHGIISRAIENAQKKVEGHNFDIRKHLLEYDDVMNAQREVIYRERKEALTNEDLKGKITDIIENKSFVVVSEFLSSKAEDKTRDYGWEAFKAKVKKEVSFELDILSDKDIEELSQEELIEIVYSQAMEEYSRKEELIGSSSMRELEHFIILQTVDTLWKDHLLNMDHLKEGIGLRGYAQQNPLIIYKKEGFDMFQSMIEKIQDEIVNILMRIEIQNGYEEEKKPLFSEVEEDKMVFSRGDDDSQPNRKTIKRQQRKIGRNELCPCGSGKKYKRCCGA